TLALAGVLAQNTEPARAFVPVVVERGNGAFVTGLTAADFSVTVAGHPAAIRSVVLDDSPAAILVIVDLTVSALPLNVDAYGVRMPVEDFLLRRFRSVDRVALAGFGRQFRAAGGFSSDFRTQRGALNDVMRLPKDD